MNVELLCPTCGSANQFTQPVDPKDETEVTCAGCNTSITVGALKTANMDRLRDLAVEAARRAIRDSLK